jgi:integrase
VHLIIRGALAEACRRGLVSRNVADVARAPRQRALQRVEGTSLTDSELRTLMRAAAGHRFFPIYWLNAMTGMRRNEVLGLKWPDIDFAKKRLHLNRGLVSVGYEVHQMRGKTKTSRRSIDLDDTTLDVLACWKAYQAAELAAVGISNDDSWVFTDGDGDGDGDNVHPQAVYTAFRRLVDSTEIPRVRFHDLRHTHGSLLIKEGVPVKVVSERLGHSHIAFTMQTYQHVLPGMQADAAAAYERLADPTSTKAGHHEKPETAEEAHRTAATNPGGGCAAWGRRPARVVRVALRRGRSLRRAEAPRPGAVAPRRWR